MPAAGAAVDRPCRVLVGPRHVLLAADRAAEVVARREHRAVAPEDHDADGVVGLGPQERVVELDEHAAVLRVPGVDAVEHDPRDRAVVERLVGDELVLGCVGHADPPAGRAATCGAWNTDASVGPPPGEESGREEPRMERIPYDEFSMFHENAEEFGLPYDGPPTVRRESVEVGPDRRLSALVWGDAEPELVFLHGGAPERPHVGHGGDGARSAAGRARPARPRALRRRARGHHRTPGQRRGRRGGDPRAGARRAGRRSACRSAA